VKQQLRLSTLMADPIVSQSFLGAVSRGALVSEHPPGRVAFVLRLRSVRWTVSRSGIAPSNFWPKHDRRLVSHKIGTKLPGSGTVWNPALSRPSPIHGTLTGCQKSAFHAPAIPLRQPNTHLRVRSPPASTPPRWGRRGH
jgi:hypothetical protein